MRCFWHNTFDDTTNLFQLSHEVILILQTTSSINHENIDTFSYSTFHAIKYDTGWVSFFRSSHHWNVHTTAPFSKLGYCPCTEGICRNQHDLLTCLFVAMCEFSDRSCFPNTINTNKEHDCQAILEVDAFIVVTILFIKLNQFLNDDMAKNVRFLGVFKLGFVT